MVILNKMINWSLNIIGPLPSVRGLVSISATDIVTMPMPMPVAIVTMTMPVAIEMPMAPVKVVRIAEVTMR